MRWADAFIAGFSSAETHHSYQRNSHCWFAFCATHDLHPYKGIRRTHGELYLRQLDNSRHGRPTQRCTDASPAVRTARCCSTKTEADAAAQRRSAPPATAKTTPQSATINQNNPSQESDLHAHGRHRPLTSRYSRYRRPWSRRRAAPRTVSLLASVRRWRVRKSSTWQCAW